ncbi:hypothetical protein [Pseudomonas sp. MWU13-2105]|uniref:hypothetical protein n=1 Tax=Pseudomonas sp. MWU13-2105 TaxID=2935074 RepID=UPI00200BD6B9|nr:hypothetical protein [Pseudomonas sp. MWU13-2105]
MSELARKEITNLEQGPAQVFTLFEQSGIVVTLELPNALSLSKNERSDYPANLMLTNNTEFTLISANFVVTLDDVVDSVLQALLATVRWKGPNLTDPLLKKMDFTCNGPIPPNGTASCMPNITGYSKIQWVATTNNGQSTETFTNSLALVSLTLGPIESIDTPTGPTIIVLS